MIGIISYSHDQRNLGGFRNSEVVSPVDNERLI